MLGRGAHHHLHRRTLLHQRAAKLGRLVAGNAAGETQDDVFSVQLIHGRQYTLQSTIQIASNRCGS